jgi:hypothetical protein
MPSGNPDGRSWYAWIQSWNFDWRWRRTLRCQTCEQRMQNVNWIFKIKRDNILKLTLNFIYFYSCVTLSTCVC